MLRGIQQTTWFGQSWDAAINDICQHELTPVGQPCLFCNEPIEWWASGVITNVHTRRGGSRRGQHLECWFKDEVGSAGHLLNLCHCGSDILDDPPGLTRRQAALAAVYLAYGYPGEWDLGRADQWMGSSEFERLAVWMAGLLRWSKRA